MKLYKRLRWIPALLIVVGSALSTSVAHATDYTWTGAVSSDWFNTRNWSPAGTPGASDTVNVASTKQISTTRSTVIILSSLTVGPKGSVHCDGSVTVNGPVSLNGANWSGHGNMVVNGPLTMVNSTWSADGSVEANGPSSITNSSIAGKAKFTINNEFTSTDSKFGGSQQLIGKNGIFKLESNGTPGNIIDSNFVNSGQVIWVSGNLQVNKNLTNNDGAVIQVQSDGRLTGNATTSLFANAGLITSSSAGGTSTIDVPYDNGGHVSVESGTLEFTQDLSQGGGETSLNGGRIVAHHGMHLKGGKLDGTGTIDGDVVNDGGEFRPGHSPGAITINGNYTQTANGSLNMEIGGTSPGVSYDQVVVNGNMTLAGTLNIIQYNGYVPTNNSNFELLNFFSFAGNFSTVNVQYAPGVTFGVTTTPISYIATAHVGTPTPTPVPTATPKPTPLPTATPKPTPLPTATPKPTPLPTATPKPTPLPTATPKPVPTATPTDTRAPSVTLTAPKNNGSYATLTKATGTATDNVGVASVTVQLYRYGTGSVPAGYWAGGSTWTATYDAAANERLATGTTSWSLVLPTLTYGKYLIAPTAKDRAGNATQANTVYFVISSGTSAVKLSTSAVFSSNATIQLTFTGAMDAVVAHDISNYLVTITTTGLKIPVQNVVINGNTLTLGLPPNSIVAGDRVIAAWSNLFDASGKVNSGRSPILTAQ